MAEKELRLFDECVARCVNQSSQKKTVPLLPEGTVKCTHLAALHV